MNKSPQVSLRSLMRSKQYVRVLDACKAMLENDPEDVSSYVAMMDAHFKMRTKDNWENERSESVRCAKQAILLGHDTGYSHRRMLLNLRELEWYNQALRLCDIVLRPDFEFANKAVVTKDYFVKARKQIQKQITKGHAKDTDRDAERLFSGNEIESVMRITRERKEREIRANKLFVRACKAWDEERYAKSNILMKQYHQIRQTL